jgi:hypothetical protein
VQPGDLVKYKPYPHRELQDLVGIITSMGDVHPGHGKFDMVWVVWNIDRPQTPAGGFVEEWMDELEVISESRRLS